MKTKPKTTPAKLPRARVRYMDLDGSIYADPIRDKDYPSTPVSVHPHRTAADARAFCRFWNMSEEERVERVAKAAYEADALPEEPGWGMKEDFADYSKIWESYRNKARAVLALFANPSQRHE